VTNVAKAERSRLCDLFLELGPDAPTLAGAWTTRDLAAHLVVRERRPDGAAGLLLKPFADHGERVRKAEAGRPWPELVERVREGPPAWSPARLQAVDTAVNTIEFFVHHEDVRRAQPGWAPRPPDPELDDALASAIGRGGGMLVRRAGVGVVLEPGDRPSITLRKGEATVAVVGPLPEGVLYVYGRKAVARVELDGPPDAVASVRAASFGL
jgi:uncharacterized protein (TIGR03085 family)